MFISVHPTDGPLVGKSAHSEIYERSIVFASLSAAISHLDHAAICGSTFPEAARAIMSGFDPVATSYCTKETARKVADAIKALIEDSISGWCESGQKGEPKATETPRSEAAADSSPDGLIPVGTHNAVIESVETIVTARTANADAEPIPF